MSGAAGSFGSAPVELVAAPPLPWLVAPPAFAAPAFAAPAFAAPAFAAPPFAPPVPVLVEVVALPVSSAEEQPVVAAARSRAAPDRTRTGARGARFEYR